ncbi:ANL family adenylate-forming protein [Alteromonas lipotrueae]|uniref:ANL family adenylate-forming protein n=1 Tax=Alteromonas lipotrueae TaxID=2803814 RepID=UPI001C4777D2|nr:fatty acid--CoA ligase family protein [Alteromonas lipotrueae]
MFIDFFLEIFEKNKNSDAIVWRDQAYSYGWLLEKTQFWQDVLANYGVTEGTVVMVDADYSPSSVALLLALIERATILVPTTTSVAHKRDEFIETAQVEVVVTIKDNDEYEIDTLSTKASHELIADLRGQKIPGLVLFSSGSTGKSKAAVHDMAKLLEKFKVGRHALRAITFLLYDHIGGVNTLLYTLSNAGCVITVTDRKPDTVLEAVDKFRAELLPTSPTFINLILISEAYKRYDLSSLSTVTYGTEPMPESVLLRFNQLFPDIKLLQTYGLSEIGILRSKSKSSSSLWMKVGGEGFQTRITTDNILEVKAYSGMLGYLNAPSPYTPDGWFHTGDKVEVNGEYIKVLGRDSEIINVGGQKVYPAEVESVLQQLDYIAEAEVYGEPNALLGNVVYSKIRLVDSTEGSLHENKKELKAAIKRFCKAHLENFQVPAKFIFDDNVQFSPRFKKQRSL